jgi:ketosteroid isomerase-like protein
MAEVREAASKAKLEACNKDDIKVRAYGDTAVASYRFTIKGKYEATDVSRQFQITDVWMKREGQWQVVSRHTASIEQPKTEQATA